MQAIQPQNLDKLLLPLAALLLWRLLCIANGQRKYTSKEQVRIRKKRNAKKIGEA
jgi:hypothetical protein